MKCFRDLIGSNAGEGVEDLEAGGRVERHDALVLRMDHGQLRSQLPQYADRCRLIVDEHAGFAAGGDLPAKNEPALVSVQAILFQDGGGAFSVSIKDAGHRGALAAVPDHVGRSFVAQQQGQRVDKDGFARARLPGQQVEAGTELHCDIVDDGVVLNPKFAQHRDS